MIVRDGAWTGEVSPETGGRVRLSWWLDGELIAAPILSEKQAKDYAQAIAREAGWMR